MVGNGPVAIGDGQVACWAATAASIVVAAGRHCDRAARGRSYEVVLDGWSPLQQLTFCQDRKTHDSQRRDRILPYPKSSVPLATRLFPN